MQDACTRTHKHTHMHAGRQAHLCTHVYTHIYTHTHACTHARRQAGTHMHVCAHTRTHTHTCMQAGRHTDAHACTHTYTHTHTHTVQTDRGEGQCCLTEILLSICRICAMEGEGLETESRGKHTSGLRLIYLSNAVKHNEKQCFSSCRWETLLQIRLQLY